MNLHFRRFMDPDPNAFKPGPTLADLDKEIIEQTDEQKAAEAEAARLAAETKAADDAKKAAEQDQLPEGVNADGSLQEGYEKDAEGNVVKKAVAGEENEGDVDPLKFWADVDKLRGAPLKVEFPDDIDPLSPEAVIIRDKAIADETIETFVNHLQRADPRGYAYLLHRQAGGNDEDFFAEKTFTLPEYATFKENMDVQQSLYTSSLLSKGLSQSQAKALVEMAIKDGKLFELADAEYKHAESSHEKSLAEIQRKNTEAQQQYERAVQSLDNTIVQTIEKGMKFIVPEADKVPFQNFIRESVEYDKQTNTFMLVKPLTKETPASELEAFYLLYKKGDLSALIQRKAQVLNSNRLGQTIKKSNQSNANGGGQNPPPAATDNVPLGSL